MYCMSVRKEAENSEDNWRSSSRKRERGEPWEFLVLGKGEASKEPDFQHPPPGQPNIRTSFPS